MNSFLMLFTMVILSFINVVTLDFVGDDHISIVKNGFFDSPKNIIHLFDDKYISRGDDYLLGKEEYFSSGAVSYRPVLTLSIFLDSILWLRNPMGYHIHSLLIHVLNVILVAFLICLIFKNNQLAFWSALLFAVHPTKVEPVCAIGFRQDLLVATFSLIAMIILVRDFDDGIVGRIKRYWGIFVCYFLALFTKESALMLPAIFLAYELLIKQRTFKEIIKQQSFFYGVLAIITLLYLYVYIFVFPNSTYQDIRLIGNSFATHFFSIFWIFARYFFDFIAPGQVTIIPGLYAPPLYPNFYWKVVIGISLFVSVVVGLIWSWKRHPKAAFFLGWFILSYLPVSNILYIANPMAHRFLYFPSIAIFTLLVIILFEIEKKIDTRSRLITLLLFLYSCCCIWTTFNLNWSWKNNFSISLKILERYPKNEQALTLLATEYFKAKECSQVIYLLNRSIIFGTENPSVLYMLGSCHADEPKLAEKFYLRTISAQPNYILVYASLANLYASEGKESQAKEYYEKSIRLSPTFFGFKSYIEFELKRRNYQEAKKLLSLAGTALKHKEQFEELREIYKDL